MVGSRVSRYEVLAKLGEGGMGVLYQARDTRLDRLVALKVLPADKVADAERRRRFVQEAKAASALNHPHIVTVFDIDEADGVHFIAMEHVDGQTLADRIGRRGLPLGEALRLSAQVADALAQAHAKGIVHRDLKPANVMVTAAGAAKVLDFGLAKLVEAQPVGEAATEDAATAARPATDQGVIVGTAAYMSPEQAEGRPVDARSDIFSFGSVLYEMVTGRRPFAGDSKVSTLAAILKEEPRPPSEIVPGVPRELERLIQHCMRKDPARRFQHMADVRTLLDQLREDSESGKLHAAATPARRLSGSALVGLGALALALAGIVWLWSRRSAAPAPEAPLVASALTAYPGREIQPTFSPDGNEVAFAWNGESEDNYDIYRKLIGPGEPLRLTRDPAIDYSPAWSPDGLSIAFLRKPDHQPVGVYVIPALGGAERRLTELGAAPPCCQVWFRGLTWTPDGKSLVVADTPPNELPGLFLMDPASGERKRLTSTAERKGRGDFDPAVSPDGRTLLFVRNLDLGNGDLQRLRLGQDGEPQGSPEPLTSDQREAANPTWLLERDELLFSLGAWQSERVVFRRSALPAPGGGARRQLPVGADATNLAYSRSSRRLAYSRSQRDSDLYRLPLRGPGEPAGEPQRLIASTRLDFQPDYSPRGDAVVFVSTRSGGEEIWLAGADGSNARQLTFMGGPLTGNPRWSPDGRTILFDSRATGSSEIYLIDAGGGTPRALTDQPSLENEASWSRDGRSIYFGSDRAGDWQVWRMPSGGGEATQVTREGGRCALESPDGRWLYYSKDPASSLWRTPVAGGPEERILESKSYCFNYLPTSEGIYFIPRGLAERAPTLAYLDLKTRTTRLLIPTVRPYLIGLALSPDGRSLLYTQMDANGADLMLVENVR